MSVNDTETIGRSPWRRLLAVTLGCIGVFVLLNAAAVTVVAVTPERCLECHARAAPNRSRCAKATTAPHVLTVTVVHRPSTLRFRRTPGIRHVPAPAMTSRGGALRGSAMRRVRQCHDVSGGPSEEGAIRVNHATCAERPAVHRLPLSRCHGDSVSWPRSYDMFDCVPCHMSQAQSVQCDYCHTERSPAERVSTGTFALTHSANWRETHGMGDPLACGACHHGRQVRVVPRGRRAAHPGVRVSHSEVAVQPDAECLTRAIRRVLR